MITNAQKQMLHVAARQLKLSRENYEAILSAQAGVSSSTDLDNKGFDKVMRRLEDLGFVNTVRPKRREHHADYMATPAQLEMISGMYIELGWTDRARQIGFNKRQCRKPWPQTRRDANKVIEGLKSMIARHEREEANGGNLPNNTDV